MTVHMIRLVAEEPPDYSVEEIRTAVEDWVNRYSETLTTERLTVTKQEGGTGTVYLLGQWRFAWAEDATVMLDDLESSLQTYVAWYRLGYHQCDHDETDRGGCSWDREREYGTVPDDIPDFVVN